MSALAHTPGPWHEVTTLSSDWPNIRYIEDEEARPIATVRSGATGKFPPHFGQAEALANARLIAAAPDLLEVLTEAAEFLGCLGGREGQRRGGMADRIRAALAKASSA